MATEDSERQPDALQPSEDGIESSLAVSVVIPVYNEASSLEGVLRDVQSSLRNVDYEVIVIDDNSPDGTGAIAESLARQMLEMRVVHRACKQGVASAILDGARVARGAVVATLNADQSEAAVLIPEMLELTNSHDIVIGSRYIRQGHYTRGWWRGIVSAGARGLARMMLPNVRVVQDPTSGFFLFRRTVIDGFDVPRSGRFGRVSIGVKLLLGLLAQGRYDSVVEVPFHDNIRTDGKSKFSKRDYFAYLSYILYLSGLLRDWRLVVRFVLVGLGGFISYAGLLYVLTDRVGLFYLFSAPVSWSIVLLSTFLIHDRWTFATRRGAVSARAPRRVLTFATAKVLSVGLNVLILGLLTEVAGLHYMASALVAAMVVVAWNYLAALKLVWRMKPMREHPGVDTHH